MFYRKMGKCDFLELDGNDPHVLFYAVGKHFIQGKPQIIRI